MKKAILLSGVLFMFSLLTSCTTDDLEFSSNTTAQELLIEDYTNALAKDGEEDDSESTNIDPDPIIIIIKKD
jgi:hypothetical protein